MSGKSKIEWTDVTWNPLRGCSLVSDGCKNCYAMKQAHRYSGPGKAYERLTEIGPDGPRWNGQVRLIESELEKPLRWERPRKIFVNSMSDLFHEKVPFAFIDKVLAVIALCPQHTFIVLTKRPERMAEYFNRADLHIEINEAGNRMTEPPDNDFAFNQPWPLPNLYLLTSIENQPTADDRILPLLQCPAVVHGISYEPALGPVDLSRWLDPTGVSCPDMCPELHYVVDGGIETVMDGKEIIPLCPNCGEGATWTGYDPGLDWIIAGGESGPGARPSHPDWFRKVRDDCHAAGVPFFFKQWGEWGKPSEGPGIHPALHGKKIHKFEDGTKIGRVGKKAAGDFLDRKQYHQFPGV